MYHILHRSGFFFSIFIIAALACSASTAQARTVTDALGRTVEVPDTVRHIICSGSGCLRLVTYLRAQGMAVAVDDIEGRRRAFDARPYALANPQFKDMPVFGGFRGQDDPEKILLLDPQPDVILKTYSSTMGYDPEELQEKTGIPVVALGYGNLSGPLRADLDATLRTMGDILGCSERAEEVIAFLDAQIAELRKRSATAHNGQRPRVFLGGVAFKGPHGFHSTEPAYPPFAFTNVVNLARDEAAAAKELSHSDIAKEQIVAWDPDILFVDLSTLQLGDKGGLAELRADPAYRCLSAVRDGRVYGLLPYNWYTKNYGSILANAWYIGSLVHPEGFADVDPRAKADAIYRFLVGEPVFERMSAMFGGHAFTAVDVSPQQ